MSCSEMGDGNTTTIEEGQNHKQNTPSSHAHSHTAIPWSALWQLVGLIVCHNHTARSAAQLAGHQVDQIGDRGPQTAFDLDVSHVPNHRHTAARPCPGQHIVALPLQEGATHRDGVCTSTPTECECSSPPSTPSWCFHRTISAGDRRTRAKEEVAVGGGTAGPSSGPGRWSGMASRTMLSMGNGWVGRVWPSPASLMPCPEHAATWFLHTSSQGVGIRQYSCPHPAVWPQSGLPAHG